MKTHRPPKLPTMETEAAALARVHASMVSRLLELAPNEGYNATPMPDIRLLRSNRPLTRTPVLYEPGIVVIAQGRTITRLQAEREHASESLRAAEIERIRANNPKPPHYS